MRSEDNSVSVSRIESTYNIETAGRALAFKQSGIEFLNLYICPKTPKLICQIVLAYPVRICTGNTGTEIKLIRDELKCRIGIENRC